MVKEYILKEGEYWGHEVYFPDGIPSHDVTSKLIARGFKKTDDDTYFIPREALALFITVAEPHRVAILQHNCLCGGIITKEDWDDFLDLLNQLKAANVKGIDKFCDKVRNFI